MLRWCWDSDRKVPKFEDEAIVRNYRLYVEGAKPQWGSTFRWSELHEVGDLFECT